MHLWEGRQIGRYIRNELDHRCQGYRSDLTNKRIKAVIDPVLQAHVNEDKDRAP